MTLKQLKATAAQYGITVDDARAFGHVGHKQTWSMAIEAAIAALKTEAQQITEEAEPKAAATATVVVQVATGETAQAIYHQVVQVMAMVMIVACYGLWRTAQAAYGKGMPWLRQAGHQWLTAQMCFAALVWRVLKVESCPPDNG